MEINSTHLAKVLSQILLKTPGNEMIRKIMKELSVHDFLKEFCLSRVSKIEFHFEPLREWRSFGNISVILENGRYFELSSENELIICDEFFKTNLEYDSFIEFVRNNEKDRFLNILNEIFEKSQSFVTFQNQIQNIPDDFSCL